MRSLRLDIQGGDILAKQIWKPSTLLNPVPVVMVTCADQEGRPNIITLAWAGTINSGPPMLSISVRKERYSHSLIKDRGEFVVNLPTEKLVYATDLCGVKSGRDTDKFKLTGLSAEKSSKVGVPIIKESPAALECVVKSCTELGTHDLFIAEIVATDVEESLIDSKGTLHLEKAGLICYSHGHYWTLGKQLGFFGYSVARKKIKR
jgi:flavin reductase (DIM6/NTAB) family NADH-FMN oxidoreductase RutF